MMERRRRLVLWGIMFLLTVLFFIKGRGPVQEEGSAAFSHQNIRPITVRIYGSVAKPGIYAVGPESSVRTVINMTLPDFRLASVDRRLLDRILQDGDALEFRSDSKQRVDITIKKMSAREMMILGIPLDPNRLGVDDWESLPGIGPTLAHRIVHDRQNNGDFKSLMDLQRVPGIGDGKIRQFAEFF